MIVDVHTHLATHQNAVPSEHVRTDEVMRPDRPVRLTNTVDDYLEAMAPVDRTFVFGIARSPEGAGAMPDLDVPGNVNDAAAAIASRQPDKVIGFMSVHPDDPSVLDEMERSAHDLGLRGVKLGPNYHRAIAFWE